MVLDADAVEADGPEPAPGASEEEPTPRLARLIALPFVPLVAAWDAFRALLRTWGELGTRMLGKLDPLFERFTGVMVRLGERIRPAIERVARVYERLSGWVQPRLERLSARMAAILARWERAKARIGEVVAPAWGAARRGLRTVLAPARAVARSVGRFTRRVRAVATSAARSIARAIRPR